MALLLLVDLFVANSSLWTLMRTWNPARMSIE